MGQIDLSVLYKSQVSLTEWFERAKHVKTDDLRSEDNTKRDRLAVLNELIGLPFDKATEFPARELRERSDRFKKFLQERGDELCALRLKPLDPTLPKLRMRGQTIKQVMTWFNQQSIDPVKYLADFVPHSNKSLWSTIFVVNNRAVWGEVIKGGHYQLTQGFYDAGKPITFYFDFKHWQLQEKNPEALRRLREIVKLILVRQPQKQKELRDRLNARFCHGYLEGYFETVASEEFGLWFIDYNRVLGEIYQDFKPSLGQITSPSALRGHVGSQGKVRGKVRIVDRGQVQLTKIAPEEILVCEMTSPDYVPLMSRAAAIVTDLGGILSHAAIISRELKKPCIVGTRNATRILKNGDRVEVDAYYGTVTLVND